MFLKTSVPWFFKYAPMALLIFKQFHTYHRLAINVSVFEYSPSHYESMIYTVIPWFYNNFVTSVATYHMYFHLRQKGCTLPNTFPHSSQEHGGTRGKKKTILQGEPLVVWTFKQPKRNPNLGVLNLTCPMNNFEFVQTGTKNTEKKMFIPISTKQISNKN